MIGAIILQVILIALNAVFTCAETAIVSLNDNQLEEMAVRFSSIVYVVQIVFFPLIWLLIAASHTLLRLCGVDPHRQTQITEEEIRLMAESGSQKGTIDTQENEFIQNVFEFNDVSVDEICTHRKDVVCVYADESREEWEKVIYENRHSFYVRRGY